MGSRDSDPVARAAGGASGFHPGPAAPAGVSSMIRKPTHAATHCSTESGELLRSARVAAG